MIKLKTAILNAFLLSLASLALASVNNEAMIQIGNIAADLGMGSSSSEAMHRSLLALDDSAILKQHELMATGKFDWAAEHKAKDGKGVYLASKDKNHVPDLIAIHPDLLFKDANLTEHRLSLVLKTATQVAAFTKKSVVWPAIPCSLPWVLGPQGALNATAGQIVKGTDGKTEWIVHVETSLPSSFHGIKETKTTVCTSKRQLTTNCLAGFPSGVTSLEFEHIKERYRLWRPYDPSPEKIILAAGKADLDFRKVLKWEEPVPRVTYHDFIKQVAGLARLPAAHTLEEHSQYTMHVVYLGQAFEIDCADAKKEGLPTYDKVFQGHNFNIYSRHLPDKPPSELAKVFDEVSKRCLA